jgi:four helix bundle protein
MFDFEKLDVYQEIKNLNAIVIAFIFTEVKDEYISKQWKRATMSIMLNLAEGTGRIVANEKKHFYTISRSSVFECVAIMDVLRGQNQIETAKYDEFYSSYEKLSKMLLGLFRNVV